MAGEGRAQLVYDGECPFCSAYVRYVRVKDALGGLELINARDGGPVVEDLRRRGYDLDEGMALKMGERVYHGADCIHVLATMSTGNDAFNRLNARIFRSPALSRSLYPVLRAGRNSVLRLLGRRKLSERAPAA